MQIAIEDIINICIGVILIGLAIYISQDFMKRGKK